jgi:hypothetical protein
LKFQVRGGEEKADRDVGAKLNGGETPDDDEK